MSILMQRVVRAVAVMTMAAASTSILAADAGATADSFPCAKAKRRMAQEDKREARSDKTIDAVREARKSCSTASACSRYDAKIKAMETRKTRHDALLARFRADVAKACQRN